MSRKQFGSLRPGSVTFFRSEAEAIATLNSERCEALKVADAMSATERKRFERYTRRMAGEARIEVWFSADDVDWIDQMARDNNDTRVDIIRWCVSQVRAMK